MRRFGVGLVEGNHAAKDTSGGNIGANHKTQGQIQFCIFGSPCVKLTQLELKFRLGGVLTSTTIY
jgi:hypothetical protein